MTMEQDKNNWLNQKIERARLDLAAGKTWEYVTDSWSEDWKEKLRLAGTPVENATPGFAKVTQYANEIVAGKYSIDSLQGQIPDSWIDGVRSLLEAKNNPINNPEQAVEVSMETIHKEVEEAKQEFNNQTNDAVVNAQNVGFEVPEHVIQEAKQEVNLDTKLSELSQEVDQKFDEIVPAKQELTSEMALDNIQSKIKESLDGLDKDDLLEQAKIQADRVYWKNRGNLDQEMSMIQHGAFINENEELVNFEKVDGEIGMHFDAHGIAKLDQFKSLIGILDNGIDPNHEFYSAPFAIPAELKAGYGAALGTAGGEAYKHGIATLVGGADQSLKESGIKHVFINDLYKGMLEPLRLAYPHYDFRLLSEQKQVLESDYNSLADKKEQVPLEDIGVKEVVAEESPVVADSSEKAEEVATNPEEKIEDIKEILHPLAKKFKELEGSLDDRYRKTNDPMFAPDLLDDLQGIVNKFDNPETVDDVIDTTKKLTELFTTMNESKDYYSTVHDYNGSKEDELKNIDSVYYELEDIRGLMRKSLMREIPNLGDKEQDFGKEVQKAMVALEDMLDGIDNYRRWLTKR